MLEINKKINLKLASSREGITGQEKIGFDKVYFLHTLLW